MDRSIAIVFNGLYVGGAEKFGVTLANKFANTGYTTTIFIFKKLDSPLLSLIDEKIEIVNIQRKSKFDIILHKQFDREINTRNIKKVFIIGLFPLFLFRILSFKKSIGIDYYISLHSTIPGSLKSYLQNFFYLRFIRKTDNVLFICKNQKLFYNHKYFFNPSISAVIYNGVDVEYYKPGVIDLLENQKEIMKIGQKEPVILLAATIRPEKGHAYAIESLRKLHINYTDKSNAHLVFIGGGEKSYVESLKALVQKCSLQSFVHFEGSQKDVRKYYELADIFTLTSFSVETFSLAALEAMCYGLPLSLTNIGGASEMVIVDKNGILTNARDINSIASSWAYLLDKKLDKTEIRKIALNNYSLDKMFKKYQEVIN